MADNTVVHIGENSPQQVAYKLMIDVMNADNTKRSGQSILEAYAKCIRVVNGLPVPK